MNYLRKICSNHGDSTSNTNAYANFLFIFNLTLCIFYILSTTTKKSYWIEHGPPPHHLQYSFYMVLIPEQGCITLMFQT